MTGTIARQRLRIGLLACAIVMSGTAGAQDKGTLDPKPLPPLANPDDPKTPAKELFGRSATAAKMEPRTIGFYAKGCLAGGAALPINGKTWQVMRLSRNRNWGHPKMVEFLERLSAEGAKVGWRGLLVGDMSQPRGGPMITGHASHQVGLDADIWLTPMPDRELTRREREEMSATMMVAADRKDVDPKVWTPAHLRDHQGGGRGAGGRAHLRQCGDQEGALPRGRHRSRVAAARCGPTGGTTITSMSASSARPAVPTASRRSRRRPATAAARSSTGGSATRCCIPSPRRSPRPSPRRRRSRARRSR